MTALRVFLSFWLAVALVLPQAPPPAQPAPSPGAPAAQQQPPAPQPAAPQTAAVQAVPAPGGGVVLNVHNAPLVDIVDSLARRLRLNYILDPRVKGAVTLNTYGEIKAVDTRALLETILRINGFAMVQVGELYRIVPVNEVSRLPLRPNIDLQTLPEDDRMVLNMVFLKYATAGELAKLLNPFVGEGASITLYEPANLLLILDNSRNMKRTMELIAMFDNDVLAAQRVRLFEVKNGRPSDIAKELESVMKAISLGGEKASTVRFLPIDRINTLIAIAPNPGVFDQVSKWLERLDVPPKPTAGSTSNYVYRVKYGRAEGIAMAIMQLYLGIPFLGGGMYGGMGYGGGMYGGGMYGGGMYGGGMYGGGMYGGGMYGGGMGYGGGMYGGGMYGGGMYPGMGYGGMYPGMGYGGMIPGLGLGLATQQGQAATGGTAGTAATGTTDLTGSYLGGAAYGLTPALLAKIPRVVPNPFDNTLLVQATPQDWEQISNLLRQLDVPPRQILVEAKIYEVLLTGDFAYGVQAFLNRRGDPRPSGTTRDVVGQFPGSGIRVTGGLLVGASRELLGVLTAAESSGRTKLISAPRVIATDSVPASLNVGDEVPTLTSQAVAGGIQQGGSTPFAQTITNRSTGVTLNVLARANPSGVITMFINQEVSAPIPPPPGTGEIPSPSFSKRSVQTQLTLEDGDMIAIGGIIKESHTFSSHGIPILHRIPVLGFAFGDKALTRERTEMVIFMRPRIIYDTTQLLEASDELRSGFKRLNRVIENDDNR